MRLRVDTPVLWLANAVADDAAGCIRPANEERPALYRHPTVAADDSAIHQLLGRIETAFDLAEPFDRIREALCEARKMGVANRG
jgi:hypothetical protein